jgi:glyoxylase-like metal-dependent hydrolase (beta-lactamase superfamily II)
MRGSFDPDNIRSALDASIAHRVTLIDGDKSNVLPGIHVRLGSGHTIGQQFVVIETKAGRRVVSGDCVYSRRQFTGHNDDGVYVPLNNAVGSVWEQLKTIDKMNDELGGDLSRLIVLHDIERWRGHRVSRRSTASGSLKSSDREDYAHAALLSVGDDFLDLGGDQVSLAGSVKWVPLWV